MYLLLESLTDSEKGLWGVMLGKGVGRPGCLAGSLRAGCWVLSGELESTGTRTISKCLFRKKNPTEQLIDTVPPSVKIYWEKKQVFVQSQLGQVAAPRAVLPASQPRHRLLPAQAPLRPQSKAVGFPDLQSSVPARSFAFSVLTFCHFSDLSQLII